MLLDVPTPELPRYTDGQLKNLVSVATFDSNRRIFLLAINHRNPGLQNAELRRGLGYAINRDGILTGVYRSGNKDYHKTLNGPFPSKSWATPPNTSELYQTQTAQSLLAKQIGERGKIRLTLKFPDDEFTSQACNQIKENIESASIDPQKKDQGPGIEITLVPQNPTEFFRDVYHTNNYELAYCQYDYRDHLFWFGGLFEPSASQAKGRNFMGYLAEGNGTTDADRALGRKLNELRGHRDFNQELKGRMHEIHRLFREQMPFIPLWQLDRHIVVHNSLEIHVEGIERPVSASRLDPVTIFQHAERWKFRGR
jgi:ABC-type oligopeptide transport system substrate-binding subunit